MSHPHEAEHFFTPFSTREIATARAACAAGGMRLLEALEELADGSNPGFLARLASTVKLKAIALPGMEALAPAFDRLPFNEALQRECLLLSGGAGALVFVIADPFNQGLRDWAHGF